MCCLPGSVQWMRCYLFACQLPSQEYISIAPLIYDLVMCIHDTICVLHAVSCQIHKICKNEK